MEDPKSLDYLFTMLSYEKEQLILDKQLKKKSEQFDRVFEKNTSSSKPLKTYSKKLTVHLLNKERKFNESYAEFKAEDTVQYRNQKNEKCEYSYNDVKKFVQSKKFKGVKEYNDWLKDNPSIKEKYRLSSARHEMLLWDGQWESFPEFIGYKSKYNFKGRNGAKVTATYEEARQYAKTHNIRNDKEWLQLHRQGIIPKKYPSSPRFYYYVKKVWISIPDFFSRKGVENKITNNMNRVEKMIYEYGKILYILKYNSDRYGVDVYKIGVTIGGVGAIIQATKDYPLTLVTAFNIHLDFNLDRYMINHIKNIYNGLYEVKNITKIISELSSIFNPVKFGT